MIWGFIANVVYLSTLPELVACMSDCQASSIVFNYLNTKTDNKVTCAVNSQTTNPPFSHRPNIHPRHSNANIPSPPSSPQSQNSNSTSCPHSRRNAQPWSTPSRRWRWWLRNWPSGCKNGMNRERRRCWAPWRSSRQSLSSANSEPPWPSRPRKSNACSSRFQLKRRETRHWESRTRNYRQNHHLWMKK